MRRRVHIAAAAVFLTACAGTVLGQGTVPAPRRTIYVIDTAAPPVPAEVARELRNAVRQFKQDMSEIAFADDDDGAYVAYLKFMVDHRVANGITDIDLQATVRVLPSNSYDATSKCEACGAPRMRNLFLEVIDQTLFTGPNAVYRPLAVVRCKAPSQTEVELTVAPADGIGLEKKAVYTLRFRDAPRESDVQFSAVPGTFSGNTKGSFRVTGLALPKMSFIDQCRSNNVQSLLLVPHAIFRPPGSSNGNVSSATR